MTQEGGSPLEVFWAFLRLGLTSFGGPIAHLGYFRIAFVERRRWLDEAAFADLLALCQFLPGPASSQVGFAIGLMRAGLGGALAAWLGFTAPSAIAMILLGLGARWLRGPVAEGLIHGLKLVAVAVVAQAVWGMARTLAPDRTRASLAVGALALTSLAGGGWAQMLAISIGALIGLALCRPTAAAVETGQLRIPLSRPLAFASLALFVALLIGLPTLATTTDARPALVASAFYRAGALVFGGGHVVLPLLQDQVVRPGWVAPGPFLAGYAAAQALPGPLFTFAAYLGILVQPGPNGIAGGLLALAFIFLPGLLLLMAALPFWDGLRRRVWAQGAMRGANAAVVGVLAAALYSPVWTSAVFSSADFLVTAAAFVALMAWRISPVWVVAACGAVGVAARLV